MSFKSKRFPDAEQDNIEHAPKEKKPRAEKKYAPKPVASAPIGHNQGETNVNVVELFEEIAASKARQKTEAQLQRDCRNRLKTEFGILSSVTAHEIRMRQLDTDVRIQFESGCADVKVMTGYQMAMDLRDDTVARTEEEYVDPANKISAEEIQEQE